ncbi:DUF5949 family protein [Streptomyces fumanus]|uniref:Uncharacterized protein n=1 Tax=Streptomyces fumanus TaxID=67302 RepID=A0A919A379_9ACTN|nr:DUF5949 family protein [Streptomyces fumanus]GHE85393.1 hypothetical protein GCM10018772_05800 [Streptomyces fumanus]
MTSSTAAPETPRGSLLGTLTIVPWSSVPTTETPRLPFLTVYSLGDGAGGPEAGERAMRAHLEKIGLPVTGELVELTQEARAAVTLLVEAEQAVLTLPFLQVQCPVPESWQDAAYRNGSVRLICLTRPWPHVAPGEAVAPEQLRAFLTDDDLRSASSHCLVPVTRLRR